MRSPERICLVGNLCVDLIIRHVSKLPAWGRETAGDGRSLVASGQTTYTALALRSLGVPVSVVGCVGNDDWGALVVRKLEAAGANTGDIEIHSNETTALTVGLVREDGERAFVSDFACLTTPDPGLFERHARTVDAADVVALLGIFSFPGLDLVSSAIYLEQRKEAGAITILDTGWDPLGFQKATLRNLHRLLSGVTIFMPNESEACACARTKDIEEAARRIQKLGPELVVIKLGAEGVAAFDLDRSYRLPPFPVDPVSTVGAGDVFNAGFIFGMRSGWSIPRCLLAGNAAGALRVAQRGGDFPTSDDILSLMRDFDSTISR